MPALFTEIFCYNNFMFNNLKNIFDYYIRSYTKFSRKNYQSEIENPENDYVFDVLNKYFDIVFQDNITALDIGCKNWAYVRGEYNFFNQYCNKLQLDGVEIDAYRLYPNLYSRYEVAKFYMRDLSGVSYYPDDLLNIKTRYDYIVWLLPFVSLYPLKRWGLPEKFFMPEKLLEHAYSLLSRKMLIINQGKEEAEIQRKLLDRAEINYTFLGEIISDKPIFQNKRYGYLISKS